MKRKISSRKPPYPSLRERNQHANHSHNQFVNQLSKSQRKKYYRALNLTQSYVDRLHLPASVVDRVMELYRKLCRKDYIPNKKLRPVMSALLYLVSRKDTITLSFQEVLKTSKGKQKTIYRTYRKIREILRIEVKPRKLEKIVFTYKKQEDINQKVVTTALSLLEKVKEKKLHIGITPRAVVSSVFYIAYKREGNEQYYSTLAEMFNTTRLSIKNFCRTMERNKV